MRVRVLSYFGSLVMSQLSRNLKIEMDRDRFVSSGKLVYALFVDGKKEI